MRKIVLAAVLSALVFVPSQAQGVDPEKVIKFRQGSFQVLAWNFGQLVAMNKGDMPYDKAKAEVAAQRIAMVAEMLPESFLSGTYVSPSNAKANIETDKAEFDEHFKNFLTAAKQAPMGVGDEAQLKQTVGALGKTCKACHDDFRKE